LGTKLGILLLSVIILSASQAPASDAWENWQPSYREAILYRVKELAEKAKPVHEKLVNSFSRFFDMHWSDVEKSREAASLFLLDVIHPRAMKALPYYEQYIGQHLDHAIAYSYNKSKEGIHMAGTALLDNNPLAYYFLTDIPAPLKKNYEAWVYLVWQTLSDYDQAELKGRMKEEYYKRLSIAYKIVHTYYDYDFSEEATHLRRLLNDLRPFVRDMGMRDCYEVHLIDLGFENAMSTGCNIYFSRQLYNLYRNDEKKLRAVLAHEIAHGDLGHSMKTLGSFFKILGKNVVQFRNGMKQWMTYGKESEYLNSLSDKTFLDSCMHDFFDTAPMIEMSADAHAGLILERAGFSRYDLVDALEELSEKKEDFCSDPILRTGYSRSYPTFCKRKAAILEAEQWQIH